MMPYFSYPFVYDDGNNRKYMPPAAPAVPMVPTQPITPVLPTQPVVPGLPVQPVAPGVPIPPIQPVMPTQPLPPTMPSTPVCPYTGMPIVPLVPNMNNIGGMGNMGFINLTGTDEMDDMDDMDVGPSTAAAGDPPPVLSNNPATQRIVLFKELTGYPNYGNPSGNADILYTGNRGTWTFDLPAFLAVPGNLIAQIVLRAVLDDHSNVPVSRYSARITVNGTVVHDGAVPLRHGTPAGGRFTNWSELTFNVPNTRRNNRVVIVNTSTAGPNDWIAFDWMEMRFRPR